MVDIVAGKQRFDFLEQRRNVCALKFQADVFAQKFGAVHTAVGVSGMAVTVGAKKLNARIGIRCQTNGAVQAVAAVRGMYGVTIAVLVIAGLGVGPRHLPISRRIAKLGFSDFVMASEAGCGQTAMCLVSRFGELGGLALEQHRAGGITRAVQNRRPLNDGELVEHFRENISGRRIHAEVTAAKNALPINQYIQARTRHTAKYRIAIRAALADHREPGNGLEIIRPIMCRNRLARFARIGCYYQRLLHRRCGYHYLFEHGWLGSKRAWRKRQRDTDSYTFELHYLSPLNYKKIMNRGPIIVAMPPLGNVTYCRATKCRILCACFSVYNFVINNTVFSSHTCHSQSRYAALRMS